MKVHFSNIRTIKNTVYRQIFAIIFIATSMPGLCRIWFKINRIVLNTPDNSGIGIFWWEPAVGDRRGIATRDMFDEDENALPVIEVFDKFVHH